jgi:hypothetical protein
VGKNLVILVGITSTIIYNTFLNKMGYDKIIIEKKNVMRKDMFKDLAELIVCHTRKFVEPENTVLGMR